MCTNQQTITAATSQPKSSPTSKVSIHLSISWLCSCRQLSSQLTASVVHHSEKGVATCRLPFPTWQCPRLCHRSKGAKSCPAPHRGTYLPWVRCESHASSRGRPLYLWFSCSMWSGGSVAWRAHHELWKKKDKTSREQRLLLPLQLCQQTEKQWQHTGRFGLSNHATGCRHS